MRSESTLMRINFSPEQNGLRLGDLVNLYNETPEHNEGEELEAAAALLGRPFTPGVRLAFGNNAFTPDLHYLIVHGVRRRQQDAFDTVGFQPPYFKNTFFRRAGDGKAFKKIIRHK